MSTTKAERLNYEPPLITRVKLEDKPVVAQIACKDSPAPVPQGCGDVVIEGAGPDGSDLVKIPGHDLAQS